MSTSLIDASVWVAARDPKDRFHAEARALVFDFDRSVGALDLTLYEVANVIGARRGEVAEAGYMIQLIGKRCGATLLAVDAPLLDSALELASEHGLTAYDAAYVAAARGHGMTLISADLADLVSKGLAVAPDAANYP